MEIPFDEHLKIMIVDDEENFTKVLGWKLKYQGYDPSSFTNPLEALEHVKDNFYDLLLLDVQMPEIDGVMFLTELRKIPHGSDMPVIMLTADSSSETVKKALELKADGYVLKPVEFRKLNKMMDENEQRIRKRREVYFIKYFFENYNDPDATIAHKRRLVAHLQNTKLFKLFIEDPTTFPPEQREKVLAMLRKFFSDLDNMIIQKIDPSNEKKTLETLKLIEGIMENDLAKDNILGLVKNNNTKIASKAVKILGKTTDDIMLLRRFLMNTNSRFLANLIESIWDKQDDEAVRLFKTYIRHGSPRVRANSAVGLYLNDLKEEAASCLKELLNDPLDSAVLSGLWAVEFLGARECENEVQNMINSDNEKIQERAKKALEAIKKGKKPDIKVRKRTSEISQKNKLPDEDGKGEEEEKTNAEEKEHKDDDTNKKESATKAQKTESTGSFEKNDISSNN